MAELTVQQRQDVWKESQNKLREFNFVTSATKHQWATLINSLDTFLNSNNAAINASIPMPERNIFTAREKAFALRLVMKRRFEGGA